MNATAPAHEVTATAADIARLAGVGRAAVSNWRRRHPDFPAPVAGSAASPLFSLPEVEAWLRRHGKIGEVPAEERLWQILRTAATDAANLAELLGHVGDLLARHAAAETSAETAGFGSSAGVNTGPASAETGERLADLTRALTRDHRPAAVFDRLLQRYADHVRHPGHVPIRVAGLMTDLLDVAGRTVLDPITGTGSPLLAAAAGGAARLIGRADDPGTARIAAVRLRLHGHAADIAPGHGLSDAPGVPDQDGADAVVCAVPSGGSWQPAESATDPRWVYGLPPRREPEYAWLQHALAGTPPGGTAAVLVPGPVASRRGGRRIRSGLLRAGALRAVIALPPGAVPPASSAPQIWVLRQPAVSDDPPAHVLMFDSGNREWDDLAEAVRTTWRAFRRNPRLAWMTGGRAVPTLELLDEEVDLTPARHVRRPAAATGTGYEQARARLTAVVDELVDGLRGLTDVRQAPADTAMAAGLGSFTDVGEQLRAGALTLRHATAVPAVPDQAPVLTAADVAAGRAPSGRPSAERPSGDGGRAVRAMAGDVVLAAGPRHSGVRVIRSGDEPLLGPGLHLLRPASGRLDADFLAGFLRVALRRAGAARLDVRKAPLPRLPLGRQREYGAAFRSLAALDDAAGRVAELADQFIGLAEDALAGGGLHPVPH